MTLPLVATAVAVQLKLHSFALNSYYKLHSKTVVVFKILNVKVYIVQQLH